MIEEPHAVSFEAPGGPVEVVCDREKMRHVVSNLVSNAVKYSPDGGEIVVSVESEGAVARLTVADPGIGIPPEERARIFERFTQVDMSATREFGGFGLGLFIVRTIVDAHQGSVRVDSEPGSGSTFTIELPLDGPAEE
jgi:signal transduction histidine kinase